MCKALEVKEITVPCAHGTIIWKIDLSDIEELYGTESLCRLLVKYKNGRIILRYEYGAPEVNVLTVEITPETFEKIKEVIEAREEGKAWFDKYLRLKEHLERTEDSREIREELLIIAEYGEDLMPKLQKIASRNIETAKVFGCSGNVCYI